MYTKGKWFVDDEIPPNPNGIIARIGDQKVPISAIGATAHSPDNSRDDAHHICHIHNTYNDLLEACKEAHKVFKNMGSRKVTEAQFIQIWGRTADVIQQAIAKAEGEV